MRFQIPEVVPAPLYHRFELDCAYFIIFLFREFSLLCFLQLTKQMKWTYESYIFILMPIKRSYLKKSQGNLYGDAVMVEGAVQVPLLAALFLGDWLSGHLVVYMHLRYVPYVQPIMNSIFFNALIFFCARCTYVLPAKTGAKILSYKLTFDGLVCLADQQGFNWYWQKGFNEKAAKIYLWRRQSFGGKFGFLIFGELKSLSSSSN